MHASEFFGGDNGQGEAGTQESKVCRSNKFLLATIRRGLHNTHQTRRGHYRAVSVSPPSHTSFAGVATIATMVEKAGTIKKIVDRPVLDSRVCR